MTNNFKFLIFCILNSININFSYANPPDLTFDEIDKMLDKQFQDKTNQIDAIYDAYSKAIDESFKGVSKKISVKWPDDIRLPSKNTWVGYSKNLETRSVINYEKGEVIIETKVESEDLNIAKVKLDKMAKKLTSKNNSDVNELDIFAQELNQNLRNNGVNVKHSKVAQFNPLNAVLPKEKVITNIPVAKLSVSKQPKDKRGNQQISQLTNNAVTQEKVINSTKSKDTGVKLELIAKGDASILRMSIKFVNNYQKVLMEQNFDSIKQFSSQYGVPISIILAIVETESSYNPRAVSAVPAFGLMQLVPKTAGIDAHNYVHGKKKVVSPEYLFDETNNLQLGTAYFKLLQSRYLRKIKDPLSRFYCAVASYNTGVGNLAKTFTGEKSLSKAAKTINKMSAEQVYSHLLTNLPAQETRNYLKKIIARKSKYEHFDT